MTTCYHVWLFNQSGTALFRQRRCYTSRSAANTTLRRGLAGMLTDQKPGLVLQCTGPACNCRCQKERNAA